MPAAHAYVGIPRWVYVPAGVGALFVVVPLAAMVVRVDWLRFGTLITSPSSLAALRLSLQTSTASTALCLLLGVPMLHRQWAAALVVAGYATFAVGETVLAPVLTPLAATLAPEGAAGRTLAALNGAQTLATAVGPGLSGVLLAAGVPAGLVALQLACCVVSVVGAARLRRVTADVRPEVALAA